MTGTMGKRNGFNGSIKAQWPWFERGVFAFNLNAFTVRNGQPEWWR